MNPKHFGASTQCGEDFSFRVVLGKMSRAGTTLVEIKSGYGLDTDTELKMLRVIEAARLDPKVKVDVSATYCGAHAVPKCVTAQTVSVTEHQISLPSVVQD